MEPTTYYKFLTADMKPPVCAVDYKFHKGVWTRKVEPKICISGWHVCKHGHETSHIAARCFVVEGRGKKVSGDTKLAFESIRLVSECPWNKRTQVLFACECAERALKTAKVKDGRGRVAIEVARKWANGEATEAEARAAYASAYAHAAAAASFTDTAAYAAYASAAYAAYAAYASAATAYAYAAYAAAHAAAAASFTDTAEVSERKWQNKLLVKVLSGKEAFK